ncbi:MAG: hypothetical protein B7C24_06230 [Bacteroidetes bacterium 4572_77]|nr:MAG: hypothetical protein B7C24_06230 [Bacteroidetes bacterium 4572_77]
MLASSSLENQLNNSEDSSSTNRALSYKNTWSVGLIVLLLLIVFHIFVWYFFIWHIAYLFSLILFGVLWFPFVKEKNTIQLQRTFVSLSNYMKKAYDNYEFFTEPALSKKTFQKSLLYSHISCDFQSAFLLSLEKMELSSVSVHHFDKKHQVSTLVFNGLLSQGSFFPEFDGYILVKPRQGSINHHQSGLFKELYNRYLPNDKQEVICAYIPFNKHFEVVSNKPEKAAEFFQQEWMDSLLYLRREIIDLRQDVNVLSSIFTHQNSSKDSPVEFSWVGKQIFVGIRDIQAFRENSEEILDKKNKEQTMKVVQLISNFINRNI